MGYNKATVVEMLSDMKQETIDRTKRTICVCRFVQSLNAIDMVNDNLYSDEFEYLAFVAVNEGDYAMVISKLNPSQNDCGKIGIVKVVRIYTEDVPTNPMVLNRKTGFLIEKLYFYDELKRRMEESRQQKDMQDEIFARIKLVQQNMMLEELAGRDEKLRELLAEFTKRFPGKHLMIGGNH